MTLLQVDLVEERLRRHGWHVDDNGCWIWDGKTKHKFGYGQLRIKNKGYDAHRLAYAVWVAPIPEGMQVRHTCDVPACINPNHLIVGTSQDNHDDMVARGRALNGARNPMAKITLDVVLDIKHLYANGATQTYLAEKYGISQANISLIINGKRWAKAQIGGTSA